MITWIEDIPKFYAENKADIDHIINLSFQKHGKKLQLGPGVIWQLFRLKKLTPGKFIMELEIVKNTLEEVQWKINKLGESDSENDYLDLMNSMKKLNSKIENENRIIKSN